MDCRLSGRRLAAATLLAGAALLAACAGESAPSVDASAGAKPRSASPAGGTTPGTANAGDPSDTAVSDTAPPGTDVGAEPNASSSTSSSTNASSTTTTAGTSGGGSNGNPTPGPTVTKAPTTVTTAAPTTTATPKPTLNVSVPHDDTQFHCMGSATTAMVTVNWTTTNATEVAVAKAQVSDAFSSPLATGLLANGSYNFTFSCTGPDTQYTTVSAKGPGGTTTAKPIAWTKMQM